MRRYPITKKRRGRLFIQSGRSLLGMLSLGMGISLCLVWLAYTFGNIIQDARNGARMAELQETQTSPAIQSTMPALTPVPSATASIPVSAPTVTPIVSAAAPKPTVLPKLAPLLKQNPDLAGWLTIEGTVVDYPVMFTPDNEDYYLYRDFDKKEDRNGSLFIQRGCDPFAPGTNVIIHGHNMKSDKMFGSLDEYKKKTYFIKHPVIHYDTLYGQSEYEIISVFLSKVYNKNDAIFKYYQFFQANTEAEFNEFVSNIKRLALYDTGVDAKFGDTFITLSTCAYHTENGRLVVVARKSKD